MAYCDMGLVGWLLLDFDHESMRVVIVHCAGSYWRKRCSSRISLEPSSHPVTRTRHVAQQGIGGLGAGRRSCSRRRCSETHVSVAVDLRPLLPPFHKFIKGLPECGCGGFVVVCGNCGHPPTPTLLVHFRQEPRAWRSSPTVRGSPLAGIRREASGIRGWYPSVSQRDS
jgi:hypothetical protein